MIFPRKIKMLKTHFLIVKKGFYEFWKIILFNSGLLVATASKNTVNL